MREATIVALVLLAGAAVASDRFAGTVTTHQSPNGVAERCVALARIPGGDYRTSDEKDEQAFCAIDLYATNVALCPKTWSTSAGMMVYDISKGDYAGNRAGFESHACTEGKSAKDLAHDTLAKFKPTMNARGTSATFSTSSLLYYHFSRYFDTEVRVPVAVWRSMDREAHLEEVARRGLSISGHSHSSRMNRAAWKLLVDADADPSQYSPVDELFTADRTQLYGVLVTSPGHRYNTAVNGTRKSGWGKGQNLDFQETAAFRALRSDKPIAEAIAEGIEAARRDKLMRRDLGDVSAQQVAWWMREVSEIVLLDYIFSQQDRIGNIDFRTYWYWAEGGDVKHKRADHHGKGQPPAAGAILIQRTNLNDNDAGGRVAYANFTKSTGMLEKLRHFGAKTYRRLMALDRDLASGGPIHGYLTTTFGLSERQVTQVVRNTALAAGILRDSCKAGRLVFDLEPEEFFLTGTVAPVTVPCEG